jgi:DNA-binding MarR family transcriptional regulator
MAYVHILNAPALFLGGLSMHYRDIHALRILEEIEKNAGSTQRELAGKLNVSVGLVNSFIRRLARKGYLKITNVPKNRLRYILTPKGISEKTRLTYEFIQYSFDFYKTARKRLKAALNDLEKEGVRRVIFYEAGDLAEIAYISLRETGLKMVAAVDEHKAGQKFLGHRIKDPSVLNSMVYDRVIVASIDSGHAYKELRKHGVPRSKILKLE